jgi:HAE1 family hydrophobic/amphiphilic exporter-1
MTPTQDINVGARAGRGSYQYTLQDADVNELVEWSQKMLQKLRTLPQLADATSDLLANAPQLRLTINRDQAPRFGISPQLIDDTLNDAYGQRQITQFYTQLNTYFIILEILPELFAQPILPACLHFLQIQLQNRHLEIVGALAALIIDEQNANELLAE